MSDFGFCSVLALHVHRSLPSSFKSHKFTTEKCTARRSPKTTPPRPWSPWDNGSVNGTEVVAGVVHAGMRAATLVEMDGLFVDGRMEVKFDCALDCDTMQLHFVGTSESVPYRFDPLV